MAEQEMAEQEISRDPHYEILIGRIRRGPIVLRFF